MTVETLHSVAGPYAGDDANKTWTFDFKCFDESHLRLIHTDSDGIDNDVSTDFTVSLNADQDANPGGSITYPVAASALANTDKVTISRELSPVQLTDLHTQGPYDPEVVELMVDKVVMIMQQLMDITGRATVIPITSGPNASPIEFPEVREGSLLGWDENGNLVNITPCQCPDEYVDPRKTLYGKIQGSDSAIIKSGGGFSVANGGTGIHNVTFDEEITQAYGLVISTGTSWGSTVFSTSETTTGFSVATEDDETGSATIRDWSFHLEYNNQGIKNIVFPNSGFELGDLTNWTVDSGLPLVTTSTGGGSTTPYYGTYFLAASEGDQPWTVTSDAINLEDAGVDGAAIDAGRVNIKISWMQKRFTEDNNDPGRAAIRFLDASQVQIGSDVWSSYADPASWTKRTLSSAAPSGARYVQIRLNSKSDIGQYASAFFDEVQLQYSYF